MSDAADKGVAPAAPVAESSWFSGASPESQAWIGEQKIGSLDALVGGHRGLVKLKGAPAEELLRLHPAWEENAEHSAAVYARLGRPEKPDEYEVPDLPVAESDYNLASDFKTWAHEAGLSKRQAKALAEKYQAAGSKFMADRQTALEAKLAEEDLALKAEWGPADGENRQAASSAAKLIASKLGLDETTAGLDKLFQGAFGFKNGMKALALLGRSLGEHKAPQPDGTSSGDFGLTPAAIDAKLAELRLRAFEVKPGDPNALSKAASIHAERERYLRLKEGQGG